VTVTAATCSSAGKTETASGVSGRWGRRDGVDRVRGFDPGLTQLRTAVQAVLGIAVAVSAEYVFARTTGALQIDTHGAVLSPQHSALVAAQHHGVLIIAMLLGALMAMVAAFVVADPTPRDQLVSTLLLPIPMLASMGIGLLLGPYRLPSLAYLVVALMVGTYLRRYGPRGFAAGMLLFNGGFMGFFLNPYIPARNIGWVAAELGIGVLAFLLVRFGLFPPDPAKTLLRLQSSWVARSQRLIDVAWQLSARTLAPPQRGRLSRQLHRQLIRVTESTLMIDGQLAQPGATPTATLLHQRLYDMELAVSNIARFTEALSEHTLPDEVRTQIRAALTALREGSLQAASEHAHPLREPGPAAHIRRGTPTAGIDARTQVLLHRFAGSVDMFATAQHQWLTLGEQTPTRTATPSQEQPFVPAVALFAGWLPGSVPVSTRASTTPGRGPWFTRVAMAPELRASLQIGVASLIAITIGDAVDPRRFYWGLLATFLAFMATTNTGEQIRKALFRVGGTAIGIVVGDLAVHLGGTNIVVVFALVVVSLFLGIYLIRINYMFMAIGITVTMSQLYVQLGEFSWHLLLLRLAETAVGVGAVILTVLFVVPLRPQRVLTAGLLTYFEELQTLLTHIITTLRNRDEEQSASRTRSDVRRLDAAYHALLTTAAPLRAGTFGRNSTQLTTILALASIARYYARDLAHTTPHPYRAHPYLNTATEQLLSSMNTIRRRLEHDEHGTYTPSADLLTTTNPAHLDDLDDLDDRVLIADLIAIDATMATLAHTLGMDVHETAHIDAHPSGTGGVSAGPAVGRS